VPVQPAVLRAAVGRSARRSNRAATSGKRGRPKASATPKSIAALNDGCSQLAFEIGCARPFQTATKQHSGKKHEDRHPERR
jgi:hypothetical protein